jgi:translation initiation factor IF-3
MFFEKNIYKSKSKRKYKEMRVPEKIQDFDIKNKVKNIERLISRGETKFKIYT